MKRLIQIGAIWAVLLCPFPVLAVSMGQLIGQVVEKESKQPVANAEIIFENSFDKITVQADAHGFYYSNHMPTGKYQMRVVYNQRTFVMNRVRVYDNSTSEVNFMVSNNGELPEVVEIRQEFPLSSVETSDIRITQDEMQPMRTLSEVLMMQPGVDVVDGQVFIKGGGQVRVFIDGSPVMGPTRIR